MDVFDESGNLRVIKDAFHRFTRLTKTDRALADISRLLSS